MNETPTTEQTEKPEPFTIQTKEHGEWFLKKLANIDAERERITAQYQTMMQQNESDRNSLTSRYQSQFENLVRIELEASKTTRKSIVFFNGTAGFRTVPARLVVESEADAMQTARLVCPAAIVEVPAIPASEKLDKKALTDYAQTQLETTGELLPGLKQTEAREDFGIKFPSKKGGEETP